MTNNNIKKTTIGKIVGASVLFVILSGVINFLSLIPGIYIAMSGVDAPADAEPISSTTRLVVVISIFIFATYATYLNMKIFVNFVSDNLREWYFAKCIFWVYVVVSVVATIMIIFLKDTRLVFDLGWNLGWDLPWHSLVGYVNIELLTENFIPEINTGKLGGIIPIIGTPFVFISLAMIYFLLRKKFKK